MKLVTALNKDPLWLWDWNSSGRQERERPPLEDGTRGLVRDNRPGRPSACVVRRLCEK
jgi:hypothetical protein